MRRLNKLLLIAALLGVSTLAFAPDDPRQFVPTEKIPADDAIALPVDI